MESVIQQVFYHFLRIIEAIFGKLIVALPIYAKPSCIQMYYIGRYAIVAQVLGNTVGILVAQVGDATHPCAETPKWRHGCLAHEVGVFVQYFGWVTNEKEKINGFVGHKQFGGSYISSTKIAGHRC